jgi:Rad3-related DNA helicase
VLAAYEPLPGDAAIELPTGTGKTLLGLLAGEEFRQSSGRPVAYMAGNKQLAQQVEREAAS